MDDILRTPDDIMDRAMEETQSLVRVGAVPAGRRQPLVGSLPQALAVLYAAAVAVGYTARQTAWRVGARTEGLRLGRIPFLIAALLIGAAVAYNLLYEQAYEVSVGNETLGIIQTEDEFQGILSRVEARASAVLGYDYQFEHAVTYAPVTVPRGEYVSAAAFEAYLFEQVGDIMQIYVLTVGDTFIGAAAQKEELDTILDGIQAAYIDENVTSVSFVEPVNITRQYASMERLEARSLEEIQAMLTENTNGETTYLVAAGDTLSVIAKRNNMTLAELQELNPEVTPNRLSIGQTLIIREEIPYLSVRTEKTLTYEDAIDFDVQYVDNAKMYKGDSKVVTAGVKGTALVTADITYVNGREVELNVIASQTLAEPSTQVVEVGTAARPKTAPTGSLKWPLSGRISSYYGYRTIFGSYSFHSGIDITGAHGAAIKAADGGTVTFAGYKGSYGYLVIIDHGNGKQTYYAHCSSMLVSAGTKVYQGQTIAKVGATGRATGYHLHFEVRVNGSTVNPLSYLG